MIMEWTVPADGSNGVDEDDRAIGIDCTAVGGPRRTVTLDPGRRTKSPRASVSSRVKKDNRAR